jgi:site-specific recombinase XerD
MANYRKNGRQKKNGRQQKHNLTLSQALEGYRLHAQARQLSEHTLADYFTTFTRFQLFLGEDLPLAEITDEDIEEFMASLKGISEKTALNYHTGLSALWTWAVEKGFVETHIVREVEPPDPATKDIIPFTEQEVKLMLVACHRSRMYWRAGQIGKCNHSLPNRERNKAIILTLLDTGLRASELCNATIADLDLINRRLSVIGKGKKRRTVPLCSRTTSIIWRYLTNRPDYQERELLFVGPVNQPLNRHVLRRLICRIGQRSGVKNAHPHRFRHTFAINFLRNGGNIYVLQEILGHSTLDMVKRYLKLAEQDIGSTHQSASPVANWNL